jgi:ABC-type transporter Mla subunit MlaD
MPGEVQQVTFPGAGRKSGRWVKVLIVSIAVMGLACLSLLKMSGRPSLRLRTCFQDVSGLRAGATVRLAGVDVGTVRVVKAQPANKACAGAVEMDIQTPYELKIPKDSLASTATAGLLGETYLVIDASHASGPVAQKGDQLPSTETGKVTAESLLRAVKAVEVLKQLSDEEKEIKSSPTNSPPRRKAK